MSTNACEEDGHQCVSLHQSIVFEHLVRCLADILVGE